MNYQTLINIFDESINFITNKKINVLSFKTANFGDYYNKPLIDSILSSSVHILDINLYTKLKLQNHYKNKTKVLGIGSILHYADSESVIWGTGSVWYNSVPNVKPKEILSVRGLLTHKNLTTNGFKCPANFGDPGLLAYKYSSELKNNIIKKYKLGIVPHVSEYKSNLLNKFTNIPDVKVIDITNKNFLADLLSCEVIASSSLHGLIFSDSFQIPNLWISIEDKLYGGYFKFYDYYSSIYNTLNIEHIKPFNITELDSNSMIKMSTVKPINIDLNLLENGLKLYFQ